MKRCFKRLEFSTYAYVNSYVWQTTRANLLLFPIELAIECLLTIQPFRQTHIQFQVCAKRSFPSRTGNEPILNTWWHNRRKRQKSFVLYTYSNFVQQIAHIAMNSDLLYFFFSYQPPTGESKKLDCTFYLLQGEWTGIFFRTHAILHRWPKLCNRKSCA